MTIQILDKNGVEQFYSLFTQILQSEFPGYTEKVTHYLLTEIYTPQNFAYWIEKELKTVCVAEENGQYLGFMIVDSPYGGVSLLRWLGVQPEHQRKGIGKQFISLWEKIAQKQGGHKMEVAAQPEAKEFYAKAGLTLEGKREKSYFGIDQYLYGKVIGTPNDDVMIR